MKIRSKLARSVGLITLVAIFAGIGVVSWYGWNRWQSVREFDRVRTLAASIANDEFEGRFRQRPFVPDMYVPELRDDRWHWGQFEPAEFYSAEVSFRRDATDPRVRVFWAVDGSETKPRSNDRQPMPRDVVPHLPTPDLIGK